MTTGIIYARVSSIGDRQSTERQVKDLSEYAKYKGIEIRKVFEEHISGAKIVQTERNEVCFNCRGAAYLMQRRMMSVQCGVRQWNTAKQTALGSNLSENCPDWSVMRLRCLPLSRNSLTVALTSTYKRNNLYYWMKKDIHPSLLL